MFKLLFIVLAVLMAAGLGAAIGNAYGPLNSLWATPIYMILGSWAVIVGDQLDRKMF